MKYNNPQGSRHSWAATALLAILAFWLQPVASAQSNGRSGKEVVDTVCAQCHTSGERGAPKIGDKLAWSARAEQGLGGLTEHAVTGVRKMPAHGGSRNLSDLEIGRAITYMVNQSGGRWTEPVSANELAVLRTGQQVVQMQCSRCHQDGLHGAPRVGDREAWTKRLKQGQDRAVRAAISGHSGMPPRGDKADLTDAEIRSAILYMYNPGAAANAGSTDAGEMAAAARSGWQVVQAQCQKCHQEGLHGAPRIGDHDAWTQRLKQGVDYAVRSAIRGHGGMPPRGDKADLTDAEIRGAILYMYNPSASAKERK